MERLDDVEEKMEEIEAKIEELFRECKDVKEGLYRPPREMIIDWTIGYVLFSSIIPITFVQVREVLHLSIPAALLICFILVVTAFGFFAKGLGFRKI